MANEYPETIRQELEYLDWERKHLKHFQSPFEVFTIHVPAGTTDAECAALAAKMNCRVMRDAT